MENDPGSKPRGDGDRMKPLPGKDGVVWLFWSSLGLGNEIFEEESGDRDGSCLGVLFVELGEALSGFAIRRPPSDWVRFMLFAIMMNRSIDEDDPPRHVEPKPSVRKKRSVTLERYLKWVIVSKVVTSTGILPNADRFADYRHCIEILRI